MDYRQRLTASKDVEIGKTRSPQDLLNAEAALGIKMPHEVGQFLLACNYFVIPHLGVESVALSPDDENPVSLVETASDAWSDCGRRLWRRFLPFMHDGAGGYTCVDLESDDDPRMFVWDHENPDVASPTPVLDGLLYKGRFSEWIEKIALTGWPFE